MVTWNNLDTLTSYAKLKDLKDHVDDTFVHFTAYDREQFDTMRRLLNMLYVGVPITDENGVAFTTDTGEQWTM